MNPRNWATKSQASYARQEPKLREALLNAQFDLAQAKKFPVLILIGGVDGAGKGETVNLLNEWMDPRHIQTHAFGDATDEEAERPPMWRFWRALPPKGKIGIFFGSWYTAPIVEPRARAVRTTPTLKGSLEEIVRFEKMLCDEGVLLLKFWFHLSKKQQKKRLKELEKDPKTRWRVTKVDWERFKIYDTFREVSEHASARDQHRRRAVDRGRRRGCALPQPDRGQAAARCDRKRGWRRRVTRNAGCRRRRCRWTTSDCCATSI